MEVYKGMNMDVKGINKVVLIAVLVSILMLHVQSAKGDSDFPFPTISVVDPGRVQERFVPEEPRNLVGPMEILEQKNTPLSRSQKSIAIAKFKLSDVVVSGVTVYKKGELQRYYKPYLGKDISLADLENIAAAITAHYHGQGYVLSRAIVPAQRIVAGKAYVQVIEGYISAIYIKGDVGKARFQIEEYGEKIKQMRPLQIKKLDHYVFLLNEIPGLVVKTVLSSAISTGGAVDLTFVIKKIF